METHRVRVARQTLSFCASHCLRFSGGDCEPLHGHDFHVAVELEACLGEEHIVIDFILLEEVIRNALKELHHRLLVPTRGRGVHVEESETRVTVVCGTKRWVFPREDCVLLPLESVTTELLARWIGRRVLAGLEDRGTPRPHLLRLELEESPGRSAIYEWTKEAP